MTVEYAPRGLVGLLTPQANTTVEPEFGILMPSGYAHINGRLVSAAATIEARLVDYFETLDASCRQFANAPIDALAVGCTGASYLAGRNRETEVLASLGERLGVPAFTAATAVVDALHALGARRIALASPYPETLTRASAAYWASHGFEVTAVASALTDATQFHPIYSIRSGTAAGLLQQLANAPGTDAVLMLGTGMPTLGPLLEANRGGGTPVLSCMLCLGWKAVHAIAPDDAPLPAWIRGDHWRARFEVAMPSPTRPE